MPCVIPVWSPFNCQPNETVKNEVVIGIGSNIDPKFHLDWAINELRKQFIILKQSSWLQTQPIGIKEQPEFLNGALLLLTEMDQLKLKYKLRSIEDKLGRDRNQPKFGPRVIDLDIVVWNGEIVDDDYHKRDFLRNCIQEILPELDIPNEKNF